MAGCLSAFLSPGGARVKVEGDQAVLEYLFEVGTEASEKITDIFGDPVTRV